MVPTERRQSGIRKTEIKHRALAMFKIVKVISIYRSYKAVGKGYVERGLTEHEECHKSRIEDLVCQ